MPLIDRESSRTRSQLFNAPASSDSWLIVHLCMYYYIITIRTRYYSLIFGRSLYLWGFLRPIRKWGQTWLDWRPRHGRPWGPPTPSPLPSTASSARPQRWSDATRTSLETGKPYTVHSHLCADHTDHSNLPNLLQTYEGLVNSFLIVEISTPDCLPEQQLQESKL